MFPQSEEMQKWTGLAYEPSERQQAAAYAAAIRSFAYGLPAPWLPYSDDDRSLAWDGLTPSLATGYHGAHCDFFESIGYMEEPGTARTPAPASAAGGMLDDGKGATPAPPLVHLVV